MKKIKLLAMAAMLLTASTGFAEEKTPAFPGAEGFGRYTTGGRGGAVYHVTRLDDDNEEGSFRWACNRPGKRTIVFDVSGTIYLKSALKLQGNNVTIAGQTAPGDGICIADYPFTIEANNVILRYLRFRLGNRNVTYHEGDGLGAMDHDNIIVDHCSVSWSIDECMSVYGGKNLTVQWCLVAQSLVNAGHEKGNHGYGGNWGGSGSSYHHNLIVHHTSRTPRLGPRPGTQTDERMDMRNNVIYNWAGEGCYGGEGMNVNIVNNYYKPGAATLTRNINIQKRIAGIGVRTSDYTGHNTANPNDWDIMWHKWGTFYVTGNYNSLHSDVTNDNWTYGIRNQINNDKCDGTFNTEVEAQMKLSEPIDYYAVTTHTAETAYERVLSYVGCSKQRDSYDNTMVNDVRDGKATYTGSGNNAGFINSQNDCGGWPTLNSTAPLKDTDGDGMPDEWETANGLNPNDANDGATVCADGYTNLEHYLNSLVADITDAQNAGGTLMGSTEQADEPQEETTVTLSGDTYNGGDNNTWLFDDDYSITAPNKGYATGSSNGFKGIKFSAASWTLNIPTGKAVSAITFHGASNYDTEAYLKSLGSETFTSTQYVFPAKISGSTEVGHHHFAFDNPVTEKLPFSTSGSQAILTIDLAVIDANSSGITLIQNNIVNNKLYNLQGVEVQNPTKGIYIRNGKKIAIKTQ